jgi:hypothetical protein
MNGKIEGYLAKRKKLKIEKFVGVNLKSQE